MKALERARDDFYRAIRSSEVYVRFERVKKALEGQEEKKQIIDSFRERAYRLSDSNEPLDHMDEISELLDAEVTCVLLGERPGLSTAESMSAYLAYRATVGMPESRRTVVSNIHRDGINSVEAGAYVAEIIHTMLEKKASGVDLSL